MFILCALTFVFLGDEMDRSFSKWESTKSLYEIALKGVEEDRNNRYPTIKEFYEEWSHAIEEKR
ncbi:hypothetical protein OBCHQ24_06890 [Oceanobacillus iheyensis]|nr:hypothetical protein OBCHQ24_06890 [Oceanobacillus iheyensis]